jgi:hypothetical protein
MGNIQGWGVRNSMYIRTDQPNYVAGQMVTGVVIAQIVQPCQPKTVTLSLVGYDRAEWWWKEQHQVQEGVDENGMPRYRTEWRERCSWEGSDRGRSRRLFFEVAFPLFANFNMWGGVFPPGAYQFPFQFMLPPGLPGDFSEFYESDPSDGYIAEVRYVLRAFLDCPGFAQDTFHEQPIIIDEQVRGGLVIYKHPTVTQNVLFCCCIDKGIVSVDCTFDKSFYQVGEAVNALVSVNNQSQVNIDNLRVKLCRFVRLHSNASGMHKDFGREILNVAEFGMVPAGTLRPNVTCGVLCLARPGRPAVQPQTTNPNPQASVRVDYKVQIECSIPWCPDVDIYMPITIYQAVPQWIAPQAPPGFAPQVMPMANVQFGFPQMPSGW